jgi:hypothetical protein
MAAVPYAEEIPPLGGDTLWANMCLAYETESEPLKDLMSKPRAVHSFANKLYAATICSQGNAGQARHVICRAFADLASGRSNQSRNRSQRPLCEPRLRTAIYLGGGWFCELNYPKPFRATWLPSTLPAASCCRHSVLLAARSRETHS